MPVWIVAMTTAGAGQEMTLQLCHVRLWVNPEGN